MQNSKEEEPSFKSKTAKNFLVGGFSNGLQQLIGVVFGIILARLLTPEDYGMVAMVTIFSVLASSFQESGFVNGIANKDNASHQDYNAVFWCSIFISTLLYIILFFCAPYIALYFKTPELKNLARLAFLSFWFGSFGIAHNAFLFRNIRIKDRAITNIVALIVSNSVGVILAYNNFAYWGIAFQTVLYTCFSSGLYWYFSGFRPTFSLDFHPIRQIIGFSSKIFISNIFININNHIFTIILGRVYVVKDIGNISQASKWSLMGQSVLTNMVNNVTQPTLNKLRADHERQVRAFRKILSFTSFLAFPALFGLALIANEFILITIGIKWIESIDYLRILSIGAAFLTISAVLSNFILSLGKSNVYMWSLIAFGICQTIVLLYCHPFGLHIVMTSLCFLQFAWLFVWFFLVRKEINYTFTNIVYDVFSFGLLAAISTLFSYCFFMSTQNIYLKLGLYITSTVFMYSVLNRLFHPTILLELISHFKMILNKRAK